VTVDIGAIEIILPVLTYLLAKEDCRVGGDLQFLGRHPAVTLVM